jgi:hypothetical protein
MLGMINGFDSVEAYARMNHIVDICRGNLLYTSWEELPDEVQQSYMNEAWASEYVLTVDDMKDISFFIFNHKDRHA